MHWGGKARHGLPKHLLDRKLARLHDPRIGKAGHTFSSERGEKSVDRVFGNRRLTILALLPERPRDIVEGTRAVRPSAKFQIEERPQHPAGGVVVDISLDRSPREQGRESRSCDPFHERYSAARQPLPSSPGSRIVHCSWTFETSGGRSAWRPASVRRRSYKPTVRPAPTCRALEFGPRRADRPARRS